MKKLLLLLTMFISVFWEAKGNMVFHTPLSEGVDALRKAGWSIPAHGYETVDGALQITASNGVRNCATFDLPVEEGKSYAGSIKVKAKELTFPNGGRGATLFFGFLDANKKWINGGEFPVGLRGPSDWKIVNIGMTRSITSKIKYIQIWIALEAQGTAQFKDLEVHEADLTSGWGVDDTQNPPTFKFNSVTQTTGIASLPYMRILISKSADFPPDATFVEMAPNKTNYVLPYALEPGKWYAKAQWCTSKVFPMTATVEFTAKPLPANPPLKVTPKIPNGEYNEFPEIAFEFYPELPKTYYATLAGAKMKVKSTNGNTIVFTPTSSATKGTNDILLTVNAKTKKYLFINKAPAHKFTFRDDHMLMIDGKPFFPIGTYRDPSDNLKVFDGIEEAQFNVTHSYKFENVKVSDNDMTSYLDDCQKHNVFAFMGIPRRHLHNEDAYGLQKHCSVMYDHPALLSIYLADEPECWINRYSMKNGADAVKAACPNVPRIILLCTPDLNNEDVLFMADGLSEIFWHDPYPVGRGQITDVKKTMETMRTACKDSQSLWCVVQAFDWRQHQVQKLNPEDVEPKAGKIRCMTHLALAANVQGIIYYWLPNDRYDMRKHSPIQWAETVACGRELNQLYKYLTGRNKPQQMTLPEGVDYWCRQAADGSYAVGLINTTDKPVSFDVKVLDFNKKVTLGPWGVEVLK